MGSKAGTLGRNGAAFFYNGRIVIMFEELGVKQAKYGDKEMVSLCVIATLVKDKFVRGEIVSDSCGYYPPDYVSLHHMDGWMLAESILECGYSMVMVVEQLEKMTGLVLTDLDERTRCKDLLDSKPFCEFACDVLTPEGMRYYAKATSSSSLIESAFTLIPKTNAAKKWTDDATEKWCKENESYLPEMVREFNEEYLGKTTKPTEEVTMEAALDVSSMFIGSVANADNLLKALTDGKLTTGVVHDLMQRANDSARLTKENDDLKIQVKAKPKSVAPTKFAGTADDLTGEVTWLKASTVFGLSGVMVDLMSFDVPVWEWKDAKGNVVSHPEAPVVDEHYKFDGRLFEALRSVINKDFLWIWGHTGAGKSSLIEQIAARLKFPLITMSMDGEITRMDLIGQTKLTEKGGVTVTEFAEGVLPNAMQRPCILLMDEMDFIKGDVAYCLQTVLNSKEGTLNLLEDAGRIVERHPWSMICATANTNGRGDESGRYNYARKQSGALLNRFTTWMKVDYLTYRDELSLLKRVVPELGKDDAETICKYAKEHRSAFLKDDVEMALSLRNLIAMAQKYVDFKQFIPEEAKAMSLAFESTITNAASEDDAIAVKGIQQRIFGGAS